MHKGKSTAWEESASWYDQVVGKEGHYYHQHLILPHITRLIEEEKNPSVLDLACGQGVLVRALKKGTRYVGVDGSKSLIQAARAYHSSKEQTFIHHDLKEPLRLSQPPFTHAVCLLALQNISTPLPLLQSAHAHLKEGGRCLLLLNHPCFRIPRQSHWEIDLERKLQSRRIDRYMTPLSIPIQTHPGRKGGGQMTESFHHPLSFYTHLLKEAGFWIEEMFELCSDKLSRGKYATMENRARLEFPLFLSVIGRKK